MFLSGAAGKRTTDTHDTTPETPDTTTTSVGSMTPVSGEISRKRQRQVEAPTSDNSTEITSVTAKAAKSPRKGKAIDTSSPTTTAPVSKPVSGKQTREVKTKKKRSLGEHGQPASEAGEGAAGDATTEVISAEKQPKKSKAMKTSASKNGQANHSTPKAKKVKFGANYSKGYVESVKALKKSSYSPTTVPSRSLLKISPPEKNSPTNQSRAKASDFF